MLIFNVAIIVTVNRVYGQSSDTLQWFEISLLSVDKPWTPHLLMRIVFLLTASKCIIC